MNNITEVLIFIFYQFRLWCLECWKYHRMHYSNPEKN